jgi:Tfp pilus assembly protein PilX
MPEQLWNYYKKGWIEREKTSILKNDNGSALIYVLLILVLLTVIGLSASRTTVSELKISGNDKLHKIAFFAADSGISNGRAVLNALKKADSGNWDSLLAGNTFTWNSIGVSTLNEVLDSGGGRSVGPATFSLAIIDNDDLDSSTLVDTDNVLILTSTVIYNGARAEVEAYVHYLGSDEFAQEHYDSASTGKAGNESTGASKDVRW